MNGEMSDASNKLRTARKFTCKPLWDVISCVMSEKESERNRVSECGLDSSAAGFGLLELVNPTRNF